jgi:uncharacterized protein YdhG (YjbR/CyaY superfamily)
MKKINTIDSYIATYPDQIQEILAKLRNLIHKEVPDAQEAIKYGIPTFVLNGRNLIHFAAFTHHIGLYPTPDPIVAFKKELSIYKQTKGAVQFPLDKPIPYDLIRLIVKFRIKTYSN